MLWCSVPTGAANRFRYATDPNVAAYVKALDAKNLSRFATTYGYDESDQLDAMEVATAIAIISHSFIPVLCWRL